MKNIKYSNIQWHSNCDSHDDHDFITVFASLMEQLSTLVNSTIIKKVTYATYYTVHIRLISHRVGHAQLRNNFDAFNGENISVEIKM